MKKIAFFILVLLVLIGFFLGLEIGFAEEYYTVKINSHVRKEPTINSTAIYNLKPGAEVLKLEESKNGKWVKIKTSKGIIGWIAKSNLELSKDEAEENINNTKELVKAKKILYKTLSNVNLKKSPDSTIGTEVNLKQGTVVTLIETKGQWARVLTEDNKEGWVLKSLIRDVTEEELKECTQIKGMSFVCGAKKEEKNKAEEIKSSTNPFVSPKNIQKVPIQIIPEKQEIPKVPDKIDFPPPPPSTIMPKNSEVLKSVPKTQDPVPESWKKLPVKENKEEVPLRLLNSKQEYTEVSNNTIKISPNKTTMIEMSALDINRVYCDGEITDAVFSEEKGVKVKITGNNAFVKFVIKKIGEQEMITQTPVDIFFVCDDYVYSIIALPKRIPSTFVHLENKEKKIKETVSKTKNLPYEKKLIDIIKSIYTNKYDSNYQVFNLNKEYYLFKDIKVILTKIIDIEGEGLRAKVFNLFTDFPSSTQHIEIKEKDFLKKEFSVAPLALSLDKTKLQGKDKAVLIVLEKRISGE